MSQVPSAVQQAEELADRLQQELIARRNQPQQPEDKPNGEQPPAETPPASEPPPAQNDSQTPPATPPQDDNWEHRFKVLQGKYNSEVPRFAQENKELKARLDQLESELTELKTKPAEPLVRPEEIEEYGPGLVDLARRIAQEELRGKEAEIEKLKRQLEQVSEVTTKTVSNDFFRSLDMLAPEWKQLNEDPGFLKWLDEIDELTDEPRHSLLGKAEAARDAVRVAKFFNSYKKASSTWAANSNAALEQQVVPQTNKTPDTPPAKKIWTRGEIKVFYDRLRRGEVSDSDAIAIEADITAAQIEGRIR